jgi:hypothetical protein
MASLKEIMNVDEEDLDLETIRRGHRSVSRTSAATDPPLPPTPSYGSAKGNSSDILSAQDIRTQGPSGSSHQSPVPNANSGSPAASVTESRRGSWRSPSKDPMDPSYYSHGHGYLPGTLGTGGESSRSYVDSPGTEVPVKLTPITGRISRAKKGVPVHVCEICQKVGSSGGFQTMILI